MRKAVVLLSGGLDSATCCAVTRSEGYEIYALSFSYGQRHTVELDCAAQIASFCGARQHQIASIDLRAFGGSSLTSDIDVPKNRGGESADDIPNTYVPARNTIFLSFAVGWAEVLECDDIFIGVNAIDYSGYPDCRPEFIKAFEKMANLSTRAGVQGRHLSIHTPLINLHKSEIIQLGTSLGLDYGLTHSCYDPSQEGLACGECDSCIIRRKGFQEAGVADPTRYK
ncbi:MAG: 7-cyano-7-deazaguanine synthase QueC [Chitinivibrionales bacterium]